MENNKTIILNMNNIDFISNYPINLVYADMIYENNDFTWIHHYWDQLKENGIFIVQTDYHTNYLIRYEFEKNMNKSIFVNHLVWKNEWGNHPKNKFHQCYDDIIIFAKGKDYNFYFDKIQVDKITKSKGLNPSCRQTKTATAWIDDICLTTIAKERIKLKNGHLIKWQKPIKLLQRLLYPFLDIGDLVVDPFCGTATSGVVAKELGCDYIGIELNKEIYQIAKNRLGC